MVGPENAQGADPHHGPVGLAVGVWTPPKTSGNGHAAVKRIGVEPKSIDLKHGIGIIGPTLFQHPGQQQCLFLEGESDQRICGPVARQDPPDRASIGVEVPLTRRIERFPVNLQGAAVAEILLYRTNGFDRHDGNGLASVIKWEIVLLRIGRLDRNAVTHLD